MEKSKKGTENSKVLDIARKWYREIPFPKCYELEFEKLFAEQKDLKCTTFDSYVKESEQNAHGKNLVMLLYFCQELSEHYEAAGISKEILLDTILDFVIVVQRYYAINGRIGIAGLYGLEDYMKMRLFRIGRLQFCMTGAAMDIPSKGIKAGDSVMDVHIPANSPLTMESCRDSFHRAEQFFAMYFPNFHYKYYTCFSWVLDEGLGQFLNQNSNILKFQKLFETVHKQEQDSILHFMFRFGIKSREELLECDANTDFAKKVKEYALNGGIFYNVLGVRERD